MRKFFLLLALLACAARAADSERPTVMVVVGAPGETEFGADFSKEAEVWAKTSALAGAKHMLVGLDTSGGASDHDRLQQAIAAEAKEGANELWLVLVGHGTFDGKEAKFNLRGPDVSASELAEWLKPIRRPVAVIDTSSASAPFLAKLSAPGRVIVTSTRSGFEQNYARFGKFFADAVGDLTCDLDKDGQVSLLEAFLSASRRAAEFYKTEGRLATEHALLDDNGDGLGTPADWFHGVRATKQARDGATLDGTRAQQFVLVRSAAEQKFSPELRARRDETELKIARLRDAKAKMDADEYYRQLEKLLLELASLYDGA